MHRLYVNSKSPIENHQSQIGNRLYCRLCECRLWESLLLPPEGSVRVKASFGNRQCRDPSPRSAENHSMDVIPAKAGIQGLLAGRGPPLARGRPCVDFLPPLVGRTPIALRMTAWRYAASFIILTMIASTSSATVRRAGVRNRSMSAVGRRVASVTAFSPR